MKGCCSAVWSLLHWRSYLWGRLFTCSTDHQALTHLYRMQDTSNMLTRWSIQFQSFDFTAKHVPGKLNVVPDALSRSFGDTNGEEVPSEPRLAPICRNVPDDQSYHRPSPQECEVSAHLLYGLPVESDRDICTSARVCFSRRRSCSNCETATRRVRSLHRLSQ